MITTRGSTTVDAAIETVFDCVADARNEPRWLPGASDVGKIGDDEIQLGTTFEGTYARAGRVRIRITRYERPHRLTLSGEGRMLSFTDDIELTATPKGTALSAVMTTYPKGVMRVMAPMMARVIGKQFQSNWDSLRAYLERRES